MRQQRTPDGCGSADNRRILYDDAKLIVAAHGDPKLSAFLQAEKTFFKKYFEAHDVPAAEVVDIVEAHRSCGAACMPDIDDAYRSPVQGDKMFGTQQVDKQKDKQEEGDDSLRIREEASRKLRNALRAKNIPAHALQRLFATILRRALGNYDGQLELEEQLHRGELVRIEASSGNKWGTIRDVNRNGIVTWLLKNHGVQVEWKVIDRAIENFRRFYEQMGGERQSEKS